MTARTWTDVLESWKEAETSDCVLALSKQSDLRMVAYGFSLSRPDWPPAEDDGGMSIELIKALFNCDGCGCQFSVLIDNAQKVPDGWDLYDIAVDAVRGSIGYQDRTQKQGSSSVQDDKHLCAKCTRAADDNAEGESAA